MVAASLRNLDEDINVQRRVQELSPGLAWPLGELEELQFQLSSGQTSTGDKFKDWAIIHFGFQYQDAQHAVQEMGNYISQQKARDLVLMATTRRGKDYYVEDDFGCQLGTRNPYTLITNTHQCSQLRIGTLPENPRLMFSLGIITIPGTSAYYEARCSGRIKPKVYDEEGEISIPLETLPHFRSTHNGQWEAENPKGWESNTNRMNLLNATLIAGREEVLKYFQGIHGETEMEQASEPKELYDLVTSGLKPSEKVGWFMER